MALSTRATQGAGSNLALNPKTKQLLICGPEKVVQVCDGKTGQEVSRHVLEGNALCLAVAHKGDVVSIGFESGKVEKNTLPDFDFDDFTARCTSAVRDVEYSSSDRWAAVASDDLELLVADTDNPSQTKQLRNEKDSCSSKSVSFDPKEEFVAQIGTHGSLTVWSMSSVSAVFSTKIMEKDTSKEQNKVARAAWKPDGSVLAVPGSRSLRVLQRGSWKLTQVDTATQQEAHTQDISVVAWSPDGGYVASCGADKKVLVRDVQGDEYVVVQTATIEAEPRNMVWTGPRTLAVMDVEGNLGVLKVTAEKRAKVAGSDKASTADKAATEANKKEADKSSKSMFVDDEAGVGDSEDEGGKGKGGAETEAEEEDEAVLMEEGPTEEEPEEPEEEEEHVPTAPIQGPFLPSSSPLDASKRFLVWNLVGNIVSQSMDDHNVIEVEFMDSSQRTVRFTDYYRFIMGSMSHDGAIFASASFTDVTEDGNSNPLGTSVVFFRPFAATHIHKKQWQVNLPAGELALCVAIGSRWCAVATSKNLVRLFSTSGLQDDIITLPGPIVTMVGGDSWLAIFSHGGPPLNESQCITYQVLDMRRKSLVCSGPLGLTPKSILTWAGFSDSGVLFVMDSEGMLFALLKTYGWQWSPVLDTVPLKKSKLDSYWPVGVLDSKLMHTLLKGGDEAPSTAPKPIVSATPLKVPLLIQDQAFSRLEESQLVAKGLLSHRLVLHQLLLEDAADPRLEAESERQLLHAQNAYDTTIIKMIQASAAAENPERVLELADRLHSEKTFELAIRVANHYNMPQVAARISRMMAVRFPPLIEEVEEEQQSQPVYRREDKAMLSGRQQQAAGGDDMTDGDSPTEDSPAPQSQRPSSQPAASKRPPGASPLAALPSPPSQAPPANPFAVKSGGDKRPRGLAESLGSLVGSPSPKRPVLNRTSTFAAEAREARSKKRHDHSV